MPLQNRVTPTGEIIAHPARGLVMGNRGGVLHRPDRTLSERRWVSRQWICCVLSFNGRRRTVMSPNRYTELFFLDEATALAAGHRPCFECRRADALLFASLWAAVYGASQRAKAADMDISLHAERLYGDGAKRTHPAALDELPVGCIVIDARLQSSHLVLSDRLMKWTPAGYFDAIARPTGLRVQTLTPPAIISVLKTGYRPVLHPSAYA